VTGMRPVLLSLFSIAVAVYVSAPARAAGVVKLERIALDEGNVTALLEATSQYYVDAMRMLISERYRDEYRAIRWEALEEAMRDAPVARLEYRFTVNGTPRTRVYHAMGGRPLGSVARSIFEGPSRPGTPDTPTSPLDSGSEDEFSPRVTAQVDELAVDLQDNRFFAAFDDVNVRAGLVTDDETLLDAFVVEGKDRAFDAEFKALRAIDGDLTKGAIPRGGKIYGSISTIACSSCEYAMGRLAERYAIDIQLTQVFPSMARPEQAELIASGAGRLRGNLLIDTVTDRPLLAADLLRGAREGQIRRSLSPRALGRSFKGTPWARRSFRLGPIRLPRVSEGSSEGSPPPRPRGSREGTPGC